MVAVLASSGFFHVTPAQTWMLVAVVFVVGLAIGPLLAACTNRLCESPPARHERVALAISTAIIFALATWMIVDCEGQWIPEVRPDLSWRFGRLGFHLILLALLLTATATDLREYIIPDEVAYLGILLGVTIATASGDVQVIHLWVDWNHPLVDMSGQYVPEWIGRHPHWHGLAWSLVGAATGAGITWLARGISSGILGQEAMGLGDVTLMAMIGAFLGWQPVVIVFAIAPFCGIIVALVAKLLFNRTYIPYGPFLSLAALLVTFFWKWIWQSEPLPRVSIRRLFGDAIGLAILIGVSLVLLMVLLSLIRWWKNSELTRSGSVGEHSEER